MEQSTIIFIFMISTTIFQAVMIGIFLILQKQINILQKEIDLICEVVFKKRGKK